MNINARVNEVLSHRFGRLLNVVAQGKRGASSRFVRQTIEKEAVYWLDSPYVSTSSYHFVLITAAGDAYYRALQEFEMNTKRHKLPAAIRMKQEKQADYCTRYEGLEDEAALIRSHWLINHFAAWEGSDTSRKPISSHVDRLGIVEKTADLRVEMSESERVTREIMVGNRDYVQRTPGQDTAVDRAGVPITVPTMNLDLQIVLDLDLYKGNRSRLAPAAVGYEVRNLESARLESRQIGAEGNVIDWVEDSYPEPKYKGSEVKPTLEEISHSIKTFKGRLDYLSSESTASDDGRAVVENDDARKTLKEVNVPRRFLFGRLKWPRPFQGLEVCVTWKKPE